MGIFCTSSADMLVLGTLLIFIVERIFASTDCDPWYGGDLCPLCDNAHNVQHAILLGGGTPHITYDSSIELIPTPTITCRGIYPLLPVGRKDASAAILGSTIYYCG